MELHLSTKIVINFLNPKNISVTFTKFTNLQIYSFDLNWWRRDRWSNTNLSNHRLTAKLVLSRRERHPSPPPPSSFTAETLKNGPATSASLSFIYNPHLIIIQRHAGGDTLSRLVRKKRLTTGGVDDTEKKLLSQRRKERREDAGCRAGPSNRSWFRWFLLINSSHAAPFTNPPTVSSKR